MNYLLLCVVLTGGKSRNLKNEDKDNTQETDVDGERNAQCANERFDGSEPGERAEENGTDDRNSGGERGLLNGSQDTGRGTRIMPLDVDQNGVDQCGHDKALPGAVDEKNWSEIQTGEVGSAQCGDPEQASQTADHKGYSEIDDAAAQLWLHPNRSEGAA